MYSIDYFIKKFEAIPDNMWRTRDFTNEQGQCCVFGHCGLRKNNLHTWSEEAKALLNIFYANGESAVTVNDYDDMSYPEPTPKGRILAALNKFKNKKGLIKII